MAILFCDSFDHSVSAPSKVIDTVSEKGWKSIATSTNSVVTITSSTTVYRTGARALRLDVDGTAGYVLALATPSVGNKSSLRVAFGWRPSIITATTFGICGFRDGTTDQMSLRINSDGTFSILRGSWSTGSVLATSTYAISAWDAWYHIEFVVTFAGSSGGAYELFVDGASILSSSSSTTIVSANAYAQTAYIGWTTTNLTAKQGSYIDDFVLSDDASTRIGTAKIHVLMPSGAGTTGQWVASAGNAYQAIDETLANSDTDYVSTSTVGDKSTYAMGNTSGITGTVLAVAVNLVAKHDNTGTAEIGAVVRSGGTDYEQTGKSISSNYLNYQTLLATDPATSTTWTTSGIDAMEAGVKRTA